MNIIETENLTKRFGDTIAVDNISISIGEKEIYGFLGLNGAGKTTTIRLLLSMIKADYGSFLLFGRHVKQASNIWNDVGYLVETPHSYPELTVTENLEIFYRLRGLNEKSLIDNIINKLQLTAYKNRRVKHLSLGNKQRLGLAKVLMHKPKLLILDEPTNGLDPAGIVEVRELLKELVKDFNTTIFISSHILSEIAKLATRIGIVHEGKLIKEIDTVELEKQIIKKLRLNTGNNQKAYKILKDNNIDFIAGGDELLETSDKDCIKHPEKIAALLSKSDIHPKMLYVFEEDLESYFLRTIRRKTDEL
ncbi:MAG: ABC transporter ATP-binding protein [Ignavibacteriaceae bacterium]